MNIFNYRKRVQRKRNTLVFCVRNSTRAMTEPAYESTLSLKFIICAAVTNELILWVLRRNVLVTISGKTGECSQ